MLTAFSRHKATFQPEKQLGGTRVIRWVSCWDGQKSQCSTEPACFNGLPFLCCLLSYPFFFLFPHFSFSFSIYFLFTFFLLYLSSTSFPCSFLPFVLLLFCFPLIPSFSPYFLLRSSQYFSYFFVFIAIFFSWLIVSCNGLHFSWRQNECCVTENQCMLSHWHEETVVWEYKSHKCHHWLSTALNFSNNPAKQHDGFCFPDWRTGLRHQSCTRC